LLDLFFKPGPGHHHPATAGGANGANIGAQAHYTPLVPTARVGLAQAYNVVQLQVHRYNSISILILIIFSIVILSQPPQGQFGASTPPERSVIWYSKD
jgi:hypothetical protein